MILLMVSHTWRVAIDALVVVVIVIVAVIVDAIVENSINCTTFVRNQLRQTFTQLALTTLIQATSQPAADDANSI